MNDQFFRTDMEVRDYECDMEGIVNNAVYMNYLEHARHGFIRQKGFTFAKLIAKGIHLVVTRIELDYLYPLRTGDTFYLTTNLERISKLRFGFDQQIFLAAKDKPVLKAKVIGTALDDNGRPKYFEELEGLY